MEADDAALRAYYERGMERERIVRPNGPVFAAAITRWAARIDGMLRERGGPGLAQVSQRSIEASTERTLR